jgi:hypothetical protein
MNDLQIFKPSLLSSLRNAGEFGDKRNRSYFKSNKHSASGKRH